MAAATATAIWETAEAVAPTPMLTAMDAHGAVAVAVRSRRTAGAASSARRTEEQSIAALAVAIADARVAVEESVLICAPLGMWTALSDTPARTA